MVNTFYIYYLNGLKPGVSIEKATKNLAQLLKVTDEKAQKTLKATNRIIRKGLTQQQAEQYFAALEKVGMQVEIRDEVEDNKKALITENIQSEQRFEINDSNTISADDSDAEFREFISVSPFISLFKLISYYFFPAILKRKALSLINPSASF
jgi:hypothetical protein